MQERQLRIPPVDMEMDTKKALTTSAVIANSGQNQDPNTNGQQHISSTPQLLIKASSSCSLLATELNPEVDRSIPTRAGEQGTHASALLRQQDPGSEARALPRSVLLYYIRKLRRYTVRLPPGMQRALP